MEHAPAVSDRGTCILAWTGPSLVGPGSSGAASRRVLCVGLESRHRLAVDLEGAFRAGWSDFFATLASFSWLVSLGYTVWWVGLCHPDRHRREIDRLFREAQEAYLQGRWNDAKRRIERILSRDENDADALMQLGSLYLRTRSAALARHAFLQCLELKEGRSGGGRSSKRWPGWASSYGDAGLT